MGALAVHMNFVRAMVAWYVSAVAKYLLGAPSPELLPPSTQHFENCQQGGNPAEYLPVDSCPVHAGILANLRAK